MKTNEWSLFIPLENYKNTPRKHGLYRIGFKLEDGTFDPNYLGRACGKGVTIRKRLKNHYEGKGNKGVMEWIHQNKDPQLYISWMIISNPAKHESIHLKRDGIGKNGMYKWNKRLEHYKPYSWSWYILLILWSVMKWSLVKFWNCLCWKRKRKTPKCKRCKKYMKGNHSILNNKVVCLIEH